MIFWGQTIQPVVCIHDAMMYVNESRLQQRIPTFMTVLCYRALVGEIYWKINYLRWAGQEYRY